MEGELTQLYPRKENVAELDLAASQHGLARSRNLISSNSHVLIPSAFMTNPFNIINGSVSAGRGKSCFMSNI